MTDKTYFEKQHVSLHKLFSGKGPILRKKWKAFEQCQQLFRYQTVWSRWCWLKPTSKWRVMSKNQAGKWLLQICENLRSVGVHNMHLQHRMSKKWTWTVLRDICKLNISLTWLHFVKRYWKWSDSWRETISGNDRSFEKLIIAVDGNLAHLC